MEEKSLLAFIASAHRHTYAAPSEIKKTYKCEHPILVGHIDYDFTQGDWHYHDSYAGSTRAPGREVVFFQEVPVRSMAYQGYHNPKYDEAFFQEQVFPFLGNALMNFDDAMPFRGPNSFAEGDFHYIFDMEGDYQYFKGQEKIFYQEEIVFTQDVMGSLIK